ncbi:MAG TPA: glyoxalase [Oceanospirillales bacterium]|nr:glyoxalase [Oceanospirillaceae bacterium]HBS41981.1 glyoxalase [Oceanospirillales bacterium]|tara:strand:+ start:1784 stop:2203 length:420 start_codon:yes stop_codon:yes gene_type:complete
MNLNQISIPATDMKASVGFYGMLGFPLIVDTPHYARFRSIEGDTSFSLILESDDTPNSAVIYFETDELDALYARLIKQGIVFDQTPQDMRYLWREAILHDPAGNKIKLYYAGENRLNPPWKVKENDQSDEISGSGPQLF